ncbi:MAG: hypothetical protein KME64_37740 [Scytonematopsis contorta HA4267-MV1]|jgi:hypothetical protein|nr:hypothetical protein [Scytonematopsis contorta HA4267-MV1]
MVKLVGRPRRERPIDRVNYKLDSGIRCMFKDFIQVKRFTEGMAVEKAMLQMMSVDRLINKNQELTYQSIEQEIERIWIELNQDEE